MCFGTTRTPSGWHGRDRLRRALAVASLAVAFLAGHFAPPAFAVALSAPIADPDSVLRITFLDVGQADAVLIQAPGGRTALIDAGRDDIVPLLRQFGVSEIDLLVATHPHADHIGGMDGVIAAFPVSFYMDNGEPHSTQTYRRLLAALDARPDITYLEASPRTVTLGEVEIDVLPLLPRGTTAHNDRSVTLLVRFGEFRAFLSGDSEVRQLTHLVSQGAVREVALLKAPHHGSDNGFTREFLNAASPRVVVISVGRNNYGHPHPAALRAYAASGATVFRTDWHGHVSVQARATGDYDVVHTGAGRADGTRYHMGRRQAVWNNNGDTATLYDDTGTVVVVFDY